MPISASPIPISAAVSSNRTIFTFGSRLERTYLSNGSSAPAASRRVWRRARTHDAPSATSAIAKVM
jgi:hypothetical protein